MGKKIKIKYVIPALLLAALFIACTNEPGNGEAAEGIQTLKALDDFEKEAWSTVRINFEDLPPDGSSCGHGIDTEPISNPLGLENVLFASDYCLETAACSSPTCTPDPDNPDGMNIQLALAVGATIGLPENTHGVMLVVEGLGDMPYKVLATDVSGATSEGEGLGVYFGTSYLGFSSPAGLSRLEVLAVGPTPSCPSSPCGPLLLSEILVGIMP